MLFFDQASVFSAKSISLLQAAHAVRAELGAVFFSAKQTLCFNPVPDAETAVDHGLGTRSAFLNLYTPEQPNLHIVALIPEFIWSVPFSPWPKAVARRLFSGVRNLTTTFDWRLS
ncbi:hypothetical protein ACXYMO_01105 [Arenibacterium sp. CAU 1754]